MKTKKIALMTILLSLILVLILIESQFPPLALGVRLGLSNTVIIISLFILNFHEVLAIIILKSALTSVLSANPISFIFSITGSILAACAMKIVSHTKKFSPVGISIFGAVFHNIGQVLIAALLFNNIYLFSFVPLLLVAGMVMGYITGLISKLIYFNRK